MTRKVLSVGMGLELPGLSAETYGSHASQSEVRHQITRHSAPSIVLRYGQPLTSGDEEGLLGSDSPRPIGRLTRGEDRHGVHTR